MNKKITYKTSGVDIDRADAFVKAIKGQMAGALSSSVLQRKGAFGSLFSIDKRRYKFPVLVSSTDGVGTKLLIAQVAGKHGTIGIDLVAMNVNDILCVGAEPLFFLDYIACGRLDPVVLKSVVKGIVKGCRQSGCSLIGGETAEMPGMYKRDEYDLAGFAVGIVEKNKIIDGSGIKSGDKVIGLPSSGPHSNGFSLVRKVFSIRQQKKMAEKLLMPTRIYARELQLITGKFSVKGIAHITGGAFYNKLTKILPDGKTFIINKGSWPVPEIFQDIQKEGRIDSREMYRTFNMGIGMAIVFSFKDIAAAKRFLKGKKIKFYEIGEVVCGKKKKIVFENE